MILQKIQKGLNSKYYLPAISLIVLIFWFIPYLIQTRYFTTGTVVNALEGFGLILLALIALFVLILYKETYYSIPIITFVPFMFSHPFDVYTSPVCLYISIAILALGLIIHFIRFRTKLKFGHFLGGIILLGVGMMLGGINVKTDTRWINFLIVSGCVMGFIVLYVFLSSTIKISYENIARLMTYLGIILVMESMSYYIVKPGGISNLFSKGMNVGWGISNNVALILLFTSPFTLYLAISNEKKKCITYLLITILQFLIIVMTYSRGAILSLAIGICFMLPISIIKASDRKTFVKVILISIGVVVIGFVLFLIIYKEYASKFFDELFRINLKDYNGRGPIYKQCIEIIKQYPIFGRGILSNFNESGTYIWGHSTYLQTAMTMGFVGVVLITIHMIQKYFYLARNIKLWQITTIFGLAMSDFYGLFDVSYYFVNYMLILVVVLVSIEGLIEEPLFLYTKIKKHK